jgi:hypothetical protein
MKTSAIIVALAAFASANVGVSTATWLDPKFTQH